jgi:hypothetical protein
MLSTSQTPENATKSTPVQLTKLRIHTTMLKIIITAAGVVFVLGISAVGAYRWNEHRKDELANIHLPLVRSEGQEAMVAGLSGRSVERAEHEQEAIKHLLMIPRDRVPSAMLDFYDEVARRPTSIQKAPKDDVISELRSITKTQPTTEEQAKKMFLRAFALFESMSPTDIPADLKPVYEKLRFAKASNPGLFN